MKGISLSFAEVENYKQLEKPLYPCVFTNKIGVKNKFYFRQRISILKILDLFMYSKVPITNFNISNGLSIIEGAKILCDDRDEIINELMRKDRKIYQETMHKSSLAHEFEKSSTYRNWELTHVNYVTRDSYIPSNPYMQDNFKPFVWIDDRSKKEDKISLFGLCPCITNPFSHCRKCHQPCDENNYGRTILTHSVNWEFSFFGINLNNPLFSIVFYDVKTLDELSYISEYKILPVLKN
jgi:hypothetical protein